MTPLPTKQVEEQNNYIILSHIATIMWDKHSFVEGVLQTPVNDSGLATKFASTVYIINMYTYMGIRIYPLIHVCMPS